MLVGMWREADPDGLMITVSSAKTWYKFPEFLADSNLNLVWIETINASYVQLGSCARTKRRAHTTY
jgi:hypothetical protein